jgi:nucleoside-diphosphate-sugar epimerase
MKLRADITRARSLGFGPKINLEDGLKKYIGWYRKRIGQQDS